MNLLTEIDGHKFNIGALRSRLANIISEARDSELRVVAMTADDLIVALLAERTQAKQQFSLAEEGLANYAQEVKGAQHDIEQLMAAASAEANEVERLRALLREVYNHGENGDLHKKIGAVFGVEPGEDIPAVPQSAEHK